ncbi:hypothetical protein F383_05013 [Gossypium arboreum]|uniref:Uncharacterized protein n=1 Tax=Gossypium arboreum TaxID=29729 RepID=A0A0B0NRJ9_GOSAR|nr:hypothetical protein F383_05013 [Gossypium arboreum]
MKDIVAIRSSGIIEDCHHTIEPYFVLMIVWRTLNGWQIGLVNGLFLPTRAETRMCVSAVLLEGHFVSLGRPHDRTYEHVLGRVAKSVSTTG